MRRAGGDTTRGSRVVMDLVPLHSPSAQHAVQVAARVWWVGDVLEDDPFQCHAYLVEAGERSVLIDPGSSLTIEATLRKVEEVVSLDSIATIVLHHSDPDICDSLHVLAERLHRPDLTVVTEWRAALLLRHMAVRFPFVSVEELGWRWDLRDGRVLQFLLTPYLHFPGAFVTYEPMSGSLFSSDLFGGFNRAHRLWAESDGDFEDLRQFHEHYMPSREILMAGLAAISARFPQLDCVFPQHGYLIPHRLVASMFEQLGKLECGVMLASRSDGHLAQLLTAAAGVRRIEEILESDRSLATMLADIGEELGQLVPLEEFWAEVGSGDTVVRIDAAHADGVPVPGWTTAGDGLAVIVLPHGHDVWHVAIVLRTDRPWVPSAELTALFAMLTLPVRHVAAEFMRDWQSRGRERVLREVAVSDPLTGLPNRRMLDELQLDHAHRAVLMIDIDHFKDVNDRFGHAVGDAVLREIAGVLAGAVRHHDTVVRYGGEEFVAVVELDDSVGDVPGTMAVANRIRLAVHDLDATALGVDRPITVSIGAAVLDGRLPSLRAAIEEADNALYQAKAAGRDRSVVHGRGARPAA
jgi:two-component system, cell cycle response regulator